jgi:hypothetical protein
MTGSMTTWTIGDFDEPAPEPVGLTLDARVTLGARSDAPDHQDDRIAIGRPLCTQITAADLDDEPRAVLESEPDSTFWLLRLTCSFRADTEAPMASAWLEADLVPERPADAELTAWSMEPLSLTDQVTVSSEVSVNASFKLASKLIPFDVGPSFGSDRKHDYEKRLPWVEAHREGTDRPSWIFTQTPATDIRGVHRLRTIVAVPVGATARAEVRAGATLQLKRLGLITYRTPLTDVPDQRTVTFGPRAT